MLICVIWRTLVIKSKFKQLNKYWLIYNKVVEIMTAVWNWQLSGAYAVGLHSKIFIKFLDLLSTFWTRWRTVSFSTTLIYWNSVISFFHFSSAFYRGVFLTGINPLPYETSKFLKPGAWDSLNFAVLCLFLDNHLCR